MATVNLGSLRFDWKGAYNGSTAYAVDDVVSYNGSSYICILASTGNLPTNTTYFQPMATKGTDGTDVGTTLTTQGDMLYRDGSGLQRLAKGTASQVLKMNSSANAPEWGNLSSDFVKLATHTVSSGVGSVSIDGNGTWIDHTIYGGYIFYIRNLSTSNDSGTSVINMRFNFAGSTYTSSNYYDFSVYASGTSSSHSSGASKHWGSDVMGLGYNNMDSEESRSGYGFVEFLNTGGDENGGSGSYYPNVTNNFFSHHSNSSSLYNYRGMGYCANNAPISGLTLLPTGGNIDLGTITVYGRKK